MGSEASNKAVNPANNRTSEPTQEPVVRLKIPAMHLPEAY